MIHLDTNAALWFSAREHRRFSRRVLNLISRGPVVLSGVVLLELDLLHEKGRQRSDGETIRAKLASQLDVAVSTATMAAVAIAASRLSWTREPWDRLIVANAVADGARLVTADAHIREHFADAVW